MIADHDALRITSVGYPAKMLVGGVVGERHVCTELLHAFAASWTATVRVDQASHPDEIADLVLRNSLADLRHPPHDFVPRNHRIDRGHDTAPFIAYLVNIRVADPAE
jgi:hypothetical protein